MPPKSIFRPHALPRRNSADGRECKGPAESLWSARVSRAIVAASGSATEPKMVEDRQGMYLEQDESLDKALRGGANTRTHTNKFVPRFRPSVISCARSDYHTQQLSMIFDLHLPEDWDMGADQFRELWNQQIPILNQITLFCDRGTCL